MSTLRDLERGFTLVETIVALVLMGLVLSMLATITGQWLPNWHRGFGRIQRSEVVGIALQRIGADLAAAEYIPPNRDTRHPLFDGSESSVMFVRTAFGPNAGPGLDIVRLGEANDLDGSLTVRSRARFTPLAVGLSLSEQVHFRDPVVLLRAPFSLAFAYAGPDRVWRNTWRNAARLPAMIRLTIREATSERVFSVSTVVLVHIQAPSDCTGEGGACDDDKASAQDGAQPAGQGATQ